jgi:ligand-binding SRPBCC domain-containing protein
MPIIELTTRIAAPRERVFDLARSIELHQAGTSQTSERAIAGTTSGRIGLNETVTWRARHFGITQTLTSIITALDRPYHFADAQVEGAFKRFDHDHFFDEENGVTIVRDRFDYEAPFGVLGRIAERIALTRHMTRFLAMRNEVLKRVAESPDAWRQYLA